MKILCISYCGHDQINGYASSKNEYFSFILRSDNEVVIDGRFPIKNYRSYKLFAQICGKYDAYSFFLKKPIPVKGLDFAFLTQLYKTLRGAGSSTNESNKGQTL